MSYYIRLRKLSLVLNVCGKFICTAIYDDLFRIFYSYQNNNNSL